MKQNWDSWNSNCTCCGTYLAFFQTLHFASVCPVVSAGEGRKWCHVHQHPYGHPHSVATKSATVNNAKITKTTNLRSESWSSCSFEGIKLVNILPYSLPLKSNKNVEFNCETQKSKHTLDFLSSVCFRRTVVVHRWVSALWLDNRGHSREATLSKLSSRLSTWLKHLEMSVLNTHKSELSSGTKRTIITRNWKLSQSFNTYVFSKQILIHHCINM